MMVAKLQTFNSYPNLQKFQFKSENYKQKLNVFYNHNTNIIRIFKEKRQPNSNTKWRHCQVPALSFTNQILDEKNDFYYPVTLNKNFGCF